MRLLTPAQAELDNKPDINDLLLLGQAALAHGAAGHTIATSATGPLSQALLPQPSSSFLTAPSTATAAVHQSLLTVAVAPATQPPPLLPQHPVKIEAATGVPPAVSLLPQPPPSTPPVDPEHCLHQSEQDLKALSERMCMPPPPPPPLPPAQRASPPSGVSSTSEELSVGTKKTAKASTTSTIANDRSDIGKKRRREARHTGFCAFVPGKIKSALILHTAHVDCICIYSVCV